MSRHTPALADFRRIVVKVGSSLLVDAEGGRAREAWLVEERPQMAAHLRSVPRDEVVLPRPEQLLVVRPGRADQRDPAGHRLEGADGGDPRQRLYVRPPRHVHGDAVTAERLRRAMVREEAAEPHARGGELREGGWRVAHAVHHCAQAELLHRFKEELVELCGPLLVTPVAHPDQV